ncbi:unnamed protein product [Phytomonas sp. Hart1]|nr:unnamed protein product [Phytomonas sp. Hart1]|eukprot:CCW70646.1 unnamed protein product [Phytomonas sp. isolate Hart1]
MVYLLICFFIFPVDPIHCLWNARVKAFISLNSTLQSIVALGCAPITVSGLEAKFLADTARKAVSEQRLLLKEYTNWMPKAEAEPTLRGGEYPVFACRKLLLYLKEMSALEESVLDAMVKLHRPRENSPSVLVLDIMELIRPFMIDAAKIVHRFFQSVIDATESPLQWSMEDALNTAWKAQLACRSLKRVTGNIQRNFFAAYQELSPDEKHQLNPYWSSSRMVSPRPEYEFSSTKSFDDDTIQRFLTLSFHLSAKSLLFNEDVAAFNTIVTVFDLILRVMGRILPHMIAIHEFERSRFV